MKVSELFESGLKNFDPTPDQNRALENEIGDKVGFDVEVDSVHDLGNGKFKAFYTYDDPKTSKAVHKSMSFSGSFKKSAIEDFMMEAKDDMVKPHNYSVKILSKGKDKNWPALKGEIYEKDVMIGTFSRGAVRDHYVPPIESKFRSSGAKSRFEDFADSLSIAETIEALLPNK